MKLSMLESDLSHGARISAAVISYMVVALFLIVVAWGVHNLYVLGNFDFRYWKIYTTLSGWAFLYFGFLLTLKAAGTILVLSMLVGMVVAFGQSSPYKIIRLSSIAYAELFRGVPTLLLMLFLYFGLNGSSFWSLIVGSSLYNSAVISNIFKAGIFSLEKGQTAAAYSLGFRYLGVMRYVVMPQATKRMLPSLLAQVIVLFKDSSLGFFIGYEEVLHRSQVIASYEHNYLQAYFVAGIIYAISCFIISRIGTVIDNHFK